MNGHIDIGITLLVVPNCQPKEIDRKSQPSLQKDRDDCKKFPGSKFSFYCN